MTALRLFTSESVTEGHPDKICDQISDSILDAIISEDPDGRVAVETLVTTGLVHVAGEVSTSAYVEIPAIVRDVVNRIGYTSSETGFDGESCGVSVSIGAQSSDIASGVNKAFEQRERGSSDPRDEQGAGDQGIMFGYATTETPQLMPVAAWTAHRMAERLAAVRRSGELAFLRPDGKTQVTLGFEGAVPRTVESVVLSTQHHPDISQEDLRAQIRESVIGPVLESTGLDLPDVKYYINPAGPFVIGGPKGDAGLTGRGSVPSRRRRLQRQGSLQSRSLSGVCHAVGRQERGSGGACRSARSAGGVRDRKGRARRAVRRDLWHRSCSG